MTGFLLTLSHELRTPLTSIVGWAILLRQKKFDPETSRALDTIERNARAQQKLLEDILDVSRIISGSFRLDVSPTEPGLEVSNESMNLRMRIEN